MSHAEEIREYEIMRWIAPWRARALHRLILRGRDRTYLFSHHGDRHRHGNTNPAADIGETNHDASHEGSQP
jgi:hypothetical protein